MAMDRQRWNDIVEGRDPQWGRPCLLLQQGTVLAALVVFSLSTLPGDMPLWLELVEWLILALFAAEYVLRLWSAPDRRAYAFGFWGIVDLLAFLPAVLLLFDSQSLRIVRLIQLLRLLKVTRYSRAMVRLGEAIMEVRHELMVSLLLATITLYLASVGIWVFEREAQPELFGTVFHAMWWAVATLTTVGYGDAYPVTAGGRAFTSVILVLGLAVVAVPTGLISAALMTRREEEEDDGA